MPSANLAAELLLMHLLGRERAFLYMNPDLDLPDQQVEAYLQLISERASGRPTQYITGHQEFWGLDFEVNPSVLIPRPETEHLVEAVLDLVSGRNLPKNGCYRIVDVGTGSGCIALALASELPGASIFATDISSAALEVAAQNARRLGRENRVELMQGDLLAPFLGPEFHGTFDFVISNPPYVAHAERESVQREVRDHEPRIAWGDLDRGEEVYGRLFPQALQTLKPGGAVAVEIGYTMKDAVLGLLTEGWTQTKVIPDLAGIPRVIVARKSG